MPVVRAVVRARQGSVSENRVKIRNELNEKPSKLAGTAAERHTPPGECRSRPLTGTLMRWALDPQSHVRVSLRPPQRSRPNPAVAEEPSRLATHSSGATPHRLSAVVAVAPAGLCGLSRSRKSQYCTGRSNVVAGVQSPCYGQCAWSARVMQFAHLEARAKGKLFAHLEALLSELASPTA